MLCSALAIFDHNTHHYFNEIEKEDNYNLKQMVTDGQ
jgi:hypothetical protein